ncbi:hypothetical protein ACFWBF_22445 [Streptomyces sp. NPDC060028]|uniref:hypothetical protein n=1 Tax=Streptomyces sp. NPDC060028 TaxID=3347041 RepID=UPI0036921347
MSTQSPTTPTPSDGPEREEARPAARPPAPAAPWVRTRLRATPVAALLGAALAFVAVLLAAALPRALDRGNDQALHAFLHAGGPGPTSLLANSTARYGEQTPQELDAVLATLRSRIGPGFTLAASGPVHGTLALKPRKLENPELTRPEGVSPQLSLAHLREAAAHTRLVAGQWPGAGTPDGPVPIALSQSAAQTLGIRVGTVLDSAPTVAGPATAEVVGLYTPVDDADAYWADLPCLTHACLASTTKKIPLTFWQTTALVGAERLDRLAPWGEEATDFWRLPVDVDALRTDRLPATSEALAAYLTGPTATRLTQDTHRPDLRITSRLPDLFTQARARQQAAAPLAAIGPAGVAGVAAVVFCLAAALGGDRREGELRLLLARGGSRRSIVGRLLGEGAVTVLPAAVLATGLAVALLPTPRLTATLLAASAATLLALLAFPVRAFVLLSAPRGPSPRRRLVGELLVLATTVAAVLEVRGRGVAPAGAGLDPLLVAAPLLLALCGGLLLARLQPTLVGALARAAGRGRALIGFLGLARAARGAGGRARPSVLPLVALLLAVTIGGFGATVLAGVDTARLEVARQAVGGDAQIAAPSEAVVPDELVRAAAALPGVRTTSSVWLDEGAYLFDADLGYLDVNVVVVDPASYAEVARVVGRGGFDPAVLTGGPAGAPVPALFNRDLAGRRPSGTHQLRLSNGGELQVKSAGTVDGTPALAGGKATLVLPAGPVTAATAQTARPNRWFALGDFDQEQLSELVRAKAPAANASRYLVRTSSAKVAELAADPLQRSAERLFWAAVAGVAGFALLAVLLTLLRAAPERAALLARLRTMGLRPRQGVLLILAESLPQAVAAALGGGLVAAAAVALLGPAVDLSTLVGSPVPTGLRLLVRPVLTQALGLAVLVAVAVLVEAATSGRRQITTELRAGDQR